LRYTSGVTSAKLPPAESPAMTIFDGATLLRDQPFVSCRRVLDRRRERVLGREAIVDRNDGHARAAAEPGEQISVAGRRAHNIVAAMKIEHEAIVIIAFGNPRPFRSDTDGVDRLEHGVFGRLERCAHCAEIRS
jgi:hypothetical protein